MNRITEKDLQAVCDRINRVTGNPLAAYARTETGCKANVGNYHLSHAYGGVELQRMHNDGGGVTTPLHTGHVPKRELYNAMHAFLAGINLKGEA